MVEKLEEARVRLAALTDQIRVKVFALFCLTVIALTAMVRLTDPENIVINIIVGITSFVGGASVGASMRKVDLPEEK